MKLAIAAHLAAVAAAAGQVAFWELPFTGFAGRAWAANFDGNVVVGEVSPNGSVRAARWVNGVLQVLPPFTRALGVDATGDVVVGAGFRWSPEAGTQSLGEVPGCTDGGFVEAWGVSQDGQVVAGMLVCSTPPPSRNEAFRWTEPKGLVPLGLSGAITGSSAYGISGDGRVIGNMALAGTPMAMKWTAETGYLPLPSGAFAVAIAASFTGRVIVGLAPGRWIADQFQPVGGLSGVSRGVSQDGLVIAGSTLGEPFVWDPIHRNRSLRSILLAYGISTQEWTVLTLTGMSGDGTTVVGYGERANRVRPWMARIPRFCYANCDDSTMGPTLNVNDFVCFLTHFADSDLFYADCNLDAALNVNDFVCFTQKFAAGCP